MASKLYIGTSDLIAKQVPHKGFTAPTILSDVYPGYFASSNDSWGLVEVDIDCLEDRAFAPFHGYSEKLTRKARKKKYSPKEIEKRRNDVLLKIYNSSHKWQTSLAECGTILYLNKIPPIAISKVTIYNPKSNAFITEECLKSNPWEFTKEDHKANYKHNSMLRNWLMCEPVGDTLTREIYKIHNLLQNRIGLELYYEKSEKYFEKWWSI